METGTLDPILDNELKNLIQPPTSPFQISMRDELSDESRHPIFAEVCADAPADVSCSAASQSPSGRPRRHAVSKCKHPDPPVEVLNALAPGR